MAILRESTVLCPVSREFKEVPLFNNNVQAYWKRLYKTTSGMEMGTLCQLRNLINRRNVTQRPKENVHAAEDFLGIVTTGHILAAVMTHLRMSSVDDMPSSAIVSHNIWCKKESAGGHFLVCGQPAC